MTMYRLNSVPANVRALPIVKGGSPNIWDEKTTTGYYDDSGAWVVNNAILSSLNPIPVRPNTTYYLHSGFSANMYPTFWVDSQPSGGADTTKFISRQNTSVTNSTFTTPSNCHAIHFNIASGYGTTYRNDISINFPANLTGYYPYNQPIVAFNTDLAEKLVSLLVEVKATQATGTPSPSNPLTITGWSNANVYVTGKNLVPMTVANIKAINTLGTWSGDTYTYNNVVYTLQTDSSGNITGISANGTANATSFLNIANNFTLQKGSYILNGCPSGGGVETARLQVNAGSLNIDTGSDVNFTLTEVYKSCVCFIRVGSGYNPNGMFFNPMVRVSSDTDDTFAISKSNTYNVSFGQTVYGAILDPLSGKLTITHMGQTFTSIINGGASSTTSWWGQLLSSGAKKAPNNNTKMDVVATYLDTATGNQVINTENDIIGVNTNGAINIKIQGMSSTADYNTYLSNNPLLVVYELETPIVIQLSSTDVQAIIGNNNIYADTGDTSLNYWVTINKYIGA